MKTTITLQVTKTVGRKSYIARIVGVSAQYGLDRVFRDTSPVDAAEFDRAMRRGKGSWTEETEAPAGLYEVSDGTTREYLCVHQRDGQDAKWCEVSVDRATAMARLMSDGMGYDDARAATKQPAAT